MKIIENNKDYFDQSVDEIKLLRYINANCDDLDGKHLLRLIDFFYHKEHKENTRRSQRIEISSLADPNTSEIKNR